MKIRLTPTNFPHHRDGWSAATRQLNKLHNCYSDTTCYDWVDWRFRNQDDMSHKWCGFLHNVIVYPKEYPEKYSGKKLIPLNKLVKDEYFLHSLKTCLGLFTLSKHTCNFLKKHITTPVVNLYHPIETTTVNFDWKKFQENPKVVMIGQWLRKYHSFFDLESPYPKYMTKIEAFASDYPLIKHYTNKDDIQWLDYLDAKTYDELLSSSIVYLNLYDVAACNTLLECLIRNTPILVNQLPAIVEYLGPNYPLYFTNFWEAETKLRSTEVLAQAHEYLCSFNKSKLSPDWFLDSFESSSIYRSLPATNLFLH